MLSRLLAVILAAIAYTASMAAQPSSKGRRPFDLRLTDPVIKLLGEVESAFGKPVREELVPNWEPSHYGESSVDPDGTPVIRLNAATGCTLSTFVHELFHPKLRSEGFPVLVFELPQGNATESNQLFLQWVSFHLRDPIEHWMFFPQMRKMNIDPDQELRSEFQEALRTGTFSGLKPATEREALALYYVKAALQLTDPAILSRVRAWYVQKGWKLPMERGEQLRRWVTEEAPRTPKDEISVFVRCINFLLDGTAKFELVSWDSLKLGTFSQVTVTIRIVPPAAPAAIF